MRETNPNDIVSVLGSLLQQKLDFDSKELIFPLFAHLIIHGSSLYNILNIDCQQCHLAISFLHDVGKYKYPSFYCGKETATKQNIKLIHQHPYDGFVLLEENKNLLSPHISHECFSLLLIITLTHHYPSKLYPHADVLMPILSRYRYEEICIPNIKAASVKNKDVHAPTLQLFLNAGFDRDRSTSLTRLVQYISQQDIKAAKNEGNIFRQYQSRTTTASLSVAAV